MSDFDENPFKEPTIIDPFNDPSIQQIAENSHTRIWVQDYNPFEHQQSIYNQDNNQPAVMPVTEDETPGNEYKQKESQTKPIHDMSEIQRKQEELERKQQELAHREEAMLHSTYNARHYNWPPLPQQCCFQPCFYQDIEVDIPMEFQKIVRHLYHLWIFHGVMMILNIIGGIIAEDFTIISLGIFYSIIFTPSSYLCWFRPAYKAFRSDSSFNFMIFFFMFFFQFIVTSIQALGISNSGTIGFITALTKFKHSSTSVETAAATMELLIASGFCCAAAADLMLISKIHRIYRSTGASFAKAQSEFSSEFIKNQHVRNAASNIAVAAVQSQLNSNSVNRRQ